MGAACVCLGPASIRVLEWIVADFAAGFASRLVQSVNEPGLANVTPVVQRSVGQLECQFRSVVCGYLVVVEPLFHGDAVTRHHLHFIKLLLDFQDCALQSHGVYEAGRKIK